MGRSTSTLLKAIILMMLGIALIILSILVVFIDVNSLLLILRLSTLSWMFIVGLILVIISYKLVTLSPPPPE